MNEAEESAESQRLEESTEEKLDPGVAYVTATRESLATTPMEGGSIIDIHKGFEVNIVLSSKFFPK